MSSEMNKIHLNNCPHNNQDHVEVIEPKKIEKFISCSGCEHRGPNLWLCLYRNCSYVGCSEQVEDHSTEHFRSANDHCIHMNLSSRRAWCYYCEKEVPVSYEMATQNIDVFASTLGMFVNKDIENGYNVSSSSSGLVGLQNIANTCYMNSAIQALSNLLPMTHYFLNCQDIMEHVLEESNQRLKTAGLAKSYQRLMKDIWENDENKYYVAPRGILYGIRSVHPMFRGFQQHDTQEFLRCFMDQLHDELKEHNLLIKQDNTLKDEREDMSQSETSSFSNSPTNSDTEYESCESNVSEATEDNRDMLHSKMTNLDFLKVKPKSDDPSLSENGKFSSIISEVFDGKLLSSVQCLTCDRISRREETFQDLSLPIPNRDYLHVLHQTYSPSMTSLNSLDINTLRNHEGWVSWLWNMLKSWLWGPSITLHDCMASFFSADELKGDNMYSCEKCKKLRTGIKYSRVLELPEVLCIHLKRFRHDLSYSSKISSHVIFPMEGFDMRPYLDKDCVSTISMYSLSSVICHHGTVGGGHYTCFARNAITNRWYEYDDQHVTEVAVEVVENSQAYVLFYQKHNAQMSFLRAKASELCMINPINQCNIKFYLSREWLSRFCTFAEPGPINNSALLCRHGGILPSKANIISKITIAISQPVWEFLYQKFGGGPAINMLYECELCKKKSETLARRQLYEFNVFTKYNSNDKDLESGTIYAISMPWLRKWQQFARGLTDKEPGPISNNHLLPNENFGSNTQIRTVKSGADFAQINGPLWKFLFDLYGGGPEIILRVALSEELEIVDKDDVKNNECISDTESNIGRNSSSPINNEEVDVANEDETSDIDNSSSKILLPSSSNSKIMEEVSLHFISKKRNKRSRSAKKNNMFGVKGNFVSKTIESTENNNHSAPPIPNFAEDAFESDSSKSFPPRKKSSRQLDINKLEMKDKSKRKSEQVVLQKFSTLPEWDSSSKESEA